MNIDELKKPLDRKNVKERTQSGFKLSYIEGWHAIDEANRIFGFDGWSRETAGLTCVREPEQINGNWRVGYIAKVRVSVAGIFRDGTGYGSGIAKDVGDAYESAVKEAETDATKRALMTFGNPFGLALYDKTQTNVQETPPPPPVPTAEEIDFRTKVIRSVREATTEAALTDIWKEIVPKMRKMNICAEIFDEIKSEFGSRKAEIQDQTKDAT